MNGMTRAVATEQKDVSLCFFTRLDLRQRWIAHGLLELVYRHGQAFAPELFDNGRKLLPADATNLDALAQLWSQADTVTMHRETRFASQVSATTLSIDSHPNTVSIWVEEAFFRLQSRTEEFLHLSIAIYDLVHPMYGNIHQTRDALEMATVYDPRYGKTVVPVKLGKGLPGIFWANFFGPPYVELIGERKLLSAPGEHVRKLSDGGVLVIATRSPLNPSTRANRSKRTAVRSHLGEDYFYRWNRPTAGRGIEI
jgi:hypothetical protein